MRSKESIFHSVSDFIQTTSYYFRKAFFVADFVQELVAGYEEFFDAAEV
jgi:hypothetical protein